MKALVTGARGFIGMRVANELAGRGFTVDGIGHGGAWEESARSAAGVTGWIASDVEPGRLPDARYDVIIHCAGGSSVARSIADSHGELAKTMQACESLLEWMRTGPSRDARFVMVSSGAVYGAAVAQPIAEDAALTPVSPYGTHKLMCEELCRSYAKTHGLSIAIVRLFSIYGAGLSRQLLWDAACKAKAGTPRFSGSGNERRDWLHVSDAAHLLAIAADHASSSAPVFNGGSGVGTRVADIVRGLFEALGVDAPPIFDGSSRAGDPPDYIADITRASALGWSAEKSLVAGLHEYARWFETCR